MLKQLRWDYAETLVLSESSKKDETVCARVVLQEPSCALML